MCVCVVFVNKNGTMCTDIHYSKPSFIRNIEKLFIYSSLVYHNFSCTHRPMSIGHVQFVLRISLFRIVRNTCPNSHKTIWRSYQIIKCCWVIWILENDADNLCESTFPSSRHKNTKIRRLCNNFYTNEIAFSKRINIGAGAKTAWVGERKRQRKIAGQFWNLEFYWKMTERLSHAIWLSASVCVSVSRFQYTASSGKVASSLIAAPKIYV